MSKIIRKGFTIVSPKQPIIGYVYELDGGNIKDEPNEKPVECKPDEEYVEDKLPKLVLRKYYIKDRIYDYREVVCFEIKNILQNAEGDIDIFAKLMCMTQDVVSAEEVFMECNAYKVLTWFQSVWNMATDV